MKAKKTPTIVFAKYSDYTDVFSSKLVARLPKHTVINNYAIELEKSKQPLYGSIYNLGPVELETLTVYIKTNLANGFIRFFKSPAGALIFFDCKLNRSINLCINYCGLNNLTIKNQYPLFWIGELLNFLGRA